ELITSRDAGAGGLVTLCQFAFVAAQGLVSNAGKQRQIPLWFHMVVTGIFFASSLVNNMALNFGISMPVHMVFRSSSLAANLILGWAFFGKRYQPEQLQGVALVTVGIVATTIADALEKSGSTLLQGCCGAPIEQDSPHLAQDAQTNSFERWLLGLAMLTAALFAISGLGQLQEWAYRKWGPASDELKFYSHALALPYFVAFQYESIGARAEVWAHSETVADALPWLALWCPPQVLHIPVLWLFLLGNVLTQAVCISGVYRLTAVSSTLTCTMTITLRKFLSIILSVLYFRNPFSPLHWIGTMCVFAGAALYSGLLTTQAWKPSKPKTE
ncbi:UDP-xylose and UDP-N-acetylglucosamine transporter (Solute carrier family 35 member B4), partial [Durusdinium trenchii]